jgi:hypothetical protein
MGCQTTAAGFIFMQRGRPLTAAGLEESRTFREGGLSYVFSIPFAMVCQDLRALRGISSTLRGVGRPAPLGLGRMKV